VTTSRSDQQDLFDTAGSYPTADWTWDDFVSASKALTDPPSSVRCRFRPTRSGTLLALRRDAVAAGGDILTGQRRLRLTPMPGCRPSRRCSRWPLRTSRCTGPATRARRPLHSGHWERYRPMGIERPIPMCTTACRSCRVNRAERTLHQRPGMWVLFNNGEAALGRRADVMQWFTRRAWRPTP